MAGQGRLEQRPERSARRARAVAAPDFVPARMVNEVLYCERLAYLEWAQGEFADNVYTVDGRVVHTRVDGAQGQLPLAQASGPGAGTAGGAGERDAGVGSAAGPAEASEARPYVARSVWLSSERLGLTAKIDVVEGLEGRVTSIEYKRGQAPDVPEGAHLPERAQVCAHVLLLREHGFVCEGAEIYFAGSRRRVPITIDEALIAETLRAIERVRAVTASAEMPPPLVDSPKCQGCSLVGICLPDEVRHLARLDASARPDQLELALEDAPVEAPGATPAVRRLHAARDDRVPLYVQSFSGWVSLDGERIIVETPPRSGSCN
jgi:CRISPR-associated protein Cas1